ncbi:MAG: UTP--glucose-1-phosphate uridylyltransferase [Planctomycetaceae bacterium]|nr:UTP--glucose-1-phosphate uridylyltransferase [Planctomycetaceae bacterium]
MSDALRERLVRHGQDHLLDGWEQLETGPRQRLLSQIESIDWAGLEQRLAAGDSLDPLAARLEQIVASGQLSGLPHLIRQAGAGEAATESRRAAEETGRQMLASGRVAVITVAGGRGTRLGWDRPKGLLPVMPVSGRTCFEHFAATIRTRGRRAGRRLPWLVMTSPATHADTLAYFREQKHFGLDPDDVVVFQQGVLPVVDAGTGRVLLSAPGEVAQSPDGHGGLLEALWTAGLLDWLKDREIDTLFYHQVDNPAVALAAPDVLGWHRLGRAQVTTRVVARRSAEESLGVVALVDGKVRIVEYSDLPARTAAATAANGSLLLWAGNTAVHVFDREFLEGVGSAALPFHRVHRIVPHVTSHAAEELVIPTAANAVQFERFVFDLLAFADVGLVVESDRGSEFLPVKRASGEDSLESARSGLLQLYGRWLEAAGARIGKGARVEIAPEWALTAEDVQGKIEPGSVLEGSVVLGLDTMPDQAAD